MAYLGEPSKEARLMMKYFVLKPWGNDIMAKASREAMLVYAHNIYPEHPEFAKEIRDLVKDAEIGS